MDQELLEQLLDFVRSRYFGKYRGTVVDNSDPTGRGRLQVQTPAVLGDLQVWAMPCVPYAGDGVGFYSLPEPGTGVWVEFEGGDPSYPIWTGCFWADNQLPDESDAAIKIWKTESLTLRLDDANDELLAEATSGSKITIASDVITASGGATHTVGSSGVTSDSGGSGKVEITSASVSVNSGAMEVM
ncbi:MAG: baseplate assembly protein [Anaerolineae bacterium]|nr:baseplate assembly protein [Anaerolineae bacterium]